MANATSISLTAIYTTTPQTPPITKYTISVNSTDTNGTIVSGFLVDIRYDGFPVASGYTPVTFRSLEPGVGFQVIVYWADSYYFRHFSDGQLNRYQIVTLNSTNSDENSIGYTAEYQYVPPGDAAALDVIAELPNGTMIGTTFNSTDYIQHTPGMWLTVTLGDSTMPFTGSFTGGSLLPFVLIMGESYTIEMTSSYGNYRFAYWKDNNSTDPSRTLALNLNSTLIAIYNYV